MEKEVEWLRDIEKSTRTAVSKLNAKVRSEALRRSDADVSVHKWVETLPAEALATPRLAPAEMWRRKRAQLAESSHGVTLESGLR